jgi:hypothetical protein
LGLPHLYIADSRSNKRLSSKGSADRHKEAVDVDGEPAVMLEKEAVRRVWVERQPRLRHKSDGPDRMHCPVQNGGYSRGFRRLVDHAL